MQKAGRKLTLTATQWVLMNAIELGNLDLDRMAENLEFLRYHGLIEHAGNFWRPTEQGKLLIALRRQI